MKNERFYHYFFYTFSQNEDLKKVCLLHDESRLHFGLTSDNKPDRPAQVEEGATFLEESTAGQAQYKIKVMSTGLHKRRKI